QDSRNIGKGVEFLNRHLCNELFAERDYWQEKLLMVLHQRHYDGIPLLINNRITSALQLVHQLEKALRFVEEHAPETPYEKLRFGLQELGFEPGWGNTAARVDETLRLLERFINTPEPPMLEAFLARIPTVFRVVLVSVHGWVAQEGSLGRSETMGRIAYVLEQARQLENQLWQDIQLAGLDGLGIQPQVVILTRLIPNCEGTQCDVRLEKLQGTHNGWILRIPFREFNPKVTHNWVSRHEIWPYLETFAQDAERELRAELRAAPDLLIGNSTDGSLVAFLLSRKFECTYCSIAHSLEKPKYLFSNLYWQDLEDQYHFSLQFTADLISMNAADAVITSSYHEIVGTPDTVGQYESYKCFTMPQLYHVVDGIDLFSSKFNVIPPGINQNFFFPYSQQQERMAGDRQRIDHLLFTQQEDGHILGHFKDLDKTPILTLAPLNSIKNPSGLVECFGCSPKLQERCNLLIVTNKLRPEEADNPEEAQEIERLYHLIDQYQLQGKVRWIGLRLSRHELGEVYRVVADRQGIFVHSSRFEAFGLTVLESMVSGLPTFATQFGGPQEIIQDGTNGFHINPMNLEETAKKILDFLHQCETDPLYWQTISNRSILHIQERYNWQSHIQQLLFCTKISSFWSYVYQNQR
ncbi:MAG TPA: sucrose synthase, partial [Allocoleopsis sp.]